MVRSPSSSLEVPGLREPELPDVMKADNVGEVANAAPQTRNEGHARAVEDACLDGEAEPFLQEKDKDRAGPASEISTQGHGIELERRVVDDPKCYYFSLEARQSIDVNALILEETGNVEVGPECCTNISSIIVIRSALQHLLS